MAVTVANDARRIPVGLLQRIKDLADRQKKYVTSCMNGSEGLAIEADYSYSIYCDRG